MLDLAGRNYVLLPFNSPAGARDSYNFSNLDEFLEVYYRSMSVLQTGKDFCELTIAYLERAAQAVRHAEIFFDPQAHTARGVDFADMVEGISQELRYGEERHGISSRLIMCFLRHLEEQGALSTLEQAMPFRDRVLGVGLDSTERETTGLLEYQGRRPLLAEGRGPPELVEGAQWCASPVPVPPPWPRRSSLAPRARLRTTS